MKQDNEEKRMQKLIDKKNLANKSNTDRANLKPPSF
jgi:hypothetical protein